jgi:hypothetical protein
LECIMADHLEIPTHDSVPISIETILGETDRPSLVRVVEELRRNQARIVTNWAVHVSTLPVFRASPTIPLGELECQIPELLSAALIVMTIDDIGVDTEPLERAQQLAAEHGRARCRNGIAIGDLLAEVQILRNEVWNAVWRPSETGPIRRATLRDFEMRLAETFDALVCAAAEAWVLEGALALSSADGS